MSGFKKFVLLLAITFLSTQNVMAEDFETNNYPTYQDGKLTIPRVDTSDQIGNFQDAVFQFDEQTGTWRLLDFKTTIITPTSEPLNTEVEVIVTDSFPAQVFLKVNGELSSGCGRLGQIYRHLDDNKFEVFVHADFSKNDPDTACTRGFVRFEALIPLSVYGLSAGTYEYSVNGGNIGTFTLSEDNKFLSIPFPITTP